MPRQQRGAGTGQRSGAAIGLLDRPDTFDARRKQLILGTCCLSLFIVGIDVAGVNVALPSIAADLDATPAQLQWVLDAYTLVLASLLMLGGSLGDRFGRRRVFQTGLVLFGVGSLACSLAPGPELLIAARAMQAVGGSMLNPVAMSIITNTFTDARERARAIGVWGGVVGLSMALGPVVGGALVDAFDWRAIFWLNVPVVVAALLLTRRLVPESRAPRPRRPDPAGQLLVIVALGTLTYAIIEGRSLGWTSAPVLGCFGTAAVALALLGYVEGRRPEPLLDPRFFRSASFSGAVLAAVVGFAAMGGFLFLNTLYLQQVRGWSPLHAGLMTLPMAAATAVCSPLSGRLVGSRGPRISMLIAGLGITASGLLLTRLTADTSVGLLAVAYLAFGIGFGALNAPVTAAAVSGMPRAQAGVAAAVASTSRQVGATLGVAMFGTLAFGALTGPIATGLPAASHIAWWVTAGCGIVLAGLGLLAPTASTAPTAPNAAVERPNDVDRAAAA